MPTYEYLCENGHTMEVQQSTRDKPLEKCECGAPCRRQLFPVGFALRGTGWAKDGYSEAPKKGKTRGKA